MRMRLRQIVMVAHDLAAAGRQIESELDVELCFRDPGVAEFGLHNALFPIGDQFLEVVSPVRLGTTAGRQLERRGGDSGYMVILEVDDLDALRRSLVDNNVRVVYEAVTEGIVGLHLHPSDIGGAILSIDQADTWGEWPWAGPNWRNHVRIEQVAEVLAVIIEADDPAAMSERWAKVLGIDAVDHTITFNAGGQIRFVNAAERGEGVAGFVVRAASPEHIGETTICDCRFELV